MLNDSIINELEEIIKFQDIIKTNELYINQNVEKFIHLMNIFYLLLF